MTLYVKSISTNEQEIKRYGWHFNAGKQLSQMEPITQDSDTAFILLSKFGLGVIKTVRLFLWPYLDLVRLHLKNN